MHIFRMKEGSGGVGSLGASALNMKILQLEVASWTHRVREVSSQCQIDT